MADTWGCAMSQIDVLHIPKEFLHKFPELDNEKANKLYNRYLKAVRKPLIKLLPFTTDRIVSFPMHNAHVMAGEFQYKNKRYYVWKEFYKLRPFFSVYEKAKFYNKKFTKVYFMNQRLIDSLIDTSDTNELVNEFYGSCDIDNLFPVKIDIHSLQAFIDHTTEELNNALNEKHQDKLRRNLRCAKYIKIISTFFKDAYGDYVLPHIPSPSPYGRTYYKGINLQNVSKEVRAAALGNHHVYDLNAAVYAIKLYLAIDLLKDKGIDHNGKFTFTKEYLDLKSSIRTQLAKHIHAYPDGMKLIKEAMTAIGFGARIGGIAYREDNQWMVPAINDIIKNLDDRNRFMNDPWVKEFVKEQQIMTKFIVDEYLKMPDFIKKIENIKDIKNNNGKFRKTQVMSYLFQHSESVIMDMIKSQTDYLVSIHDAIITTKPIHNQTLLDIKNTLHSVCPYFSISHEFVKGWESYDLMVEEVLHQQRIQQEEQLAKSRGYNTTKLQSIVHKISLQNSDNKPYIGYDDGSKYNTYDPDRDDEVRFMTVEEREEHYRIIGHNPNKVPNFIEKLL